MELTEEDNGQKSVESQPDDDSSYRFDLGKLLWEKGAEWREKAAEHFLKAAKLNPQNGEAFKYLGHYYCIGDTQRAVKCYQRAVTLVPDDSDAGEALCNLLDKEGKESLEIAVCKDALSKSPRAFWAFSRLGCLLVHQKKWSEAVQSLQHAIRGFPSSADLWEALGLSYQRLGMYTAAIKSYGRAMELENSRTFAMVESGNIFLMLGWYRKAIDQFRDALEIRSQCVSGQYGLAFGLLALSKECINQGAFSWASSLLEEASEVAEASTDLASNTSCLWKLHADIKLTYAKSFPWTGENQMGEEAFSSSLLSWKETRYSAAVSANCSYQRALHLAPWQANIYMDVGVAVNLISSLEESQEDDLNSWNLAEKMLLGSLLLEAHNYEFWMALGCVSGHKALRQHSFIRGLKMDVSLASAWAYLGKLYKEEGESELGRQAFDRARSIDPSLALPWAGMSAEINTSVPSFDEAYDSCLRAVQIMPLAEFQIGLAKLARLSGHLLSSEVFGAIKQAVQCTPSYPESHNICGLVSEGRHDYESAVSSYELARYAWKIYSSPLPHSHFADISVNLSRALYKAGNVVDAVRELEHLKERGLLNVEGLQLYAVSLCHLGKNDMALSAVRDLATCVPTIKMSSVSTVICLICTLLYSISGAGSAINSILKMPKDLLQSAKFSFVASAIDGISQTNQLQGVVSCSRRSLSLQDETIEMHLLITLSKLIRNGSGSHLSIQSGIDHLRKALHMYPYDHSLRNMLGYMLLSRERWDNNHVIRNCCSVGRFETMKHDFRSAREVLGAEGVACDATACCKMESSLSTCKNHRAQGPSVLGIMQRWFRQEPWNPNARYFLILNLLQKSRKAKYPQHLIDVLKRMTSTALINLSCLENIFERYMRFQLLLCSSEFSLLDGDISSCISSAKEASNLSLPDSCIFYAHLQLCRAHAAENNHTSLSDEFMQCFKLKTNHPIGWISLKVIETQYRPQNGLITSDSGFRDGIIESKGLWNSWLAVYNFFCGLISLQAQDLHRAEEFFAEACSLATNESCFFLCHGVICMELAKRQSDPQYITMSIRSLKKTLEVSSIRLPFVYYLLAQAEASLGSKDSKAKWERSLCYEWSSWLPGTRPAELYFQMHLLGQHGSEPTTGRDAYGDPRDWILRAIHLNPSCSRYWRILEKYME